ncbi:hypothetical protein MO867_17210 [Microbulbifer sp. OS29]|uniref:Uncharacterized protein n=1 Tax=Microbulbifer okhotskensis TaxID=2926617 RepID=A0A9X2J5Z1_9GAMM|nr:hypothetical protein [Microbulbifer okhotskensis]MCO1336072.1 hypothetical protein [Microbulbifer okhotskensis]
MNISIKPIEKFTVEVDGVAIGEFEKVSSWEGFIKLQNPKGYIIAADNSTPFTEIMGGIFGDIFGSRTETFQVLKASENLIPS